MSSHYFNIYAYEKKILYNNTIVSWVSAHGSFNMNRNFGLHGCLPGIKIPYVCIEAATVRSGPLKCGTWALTREWVLAWDTTVGMYATFIIIIIL